MFRRRGLQVCKGLCRMYSSEGSTMGKTRQVYTGERSVNSVTLLGRVGRTPEVRGSEEHPVTLFSLATSQSFQNAEGEYTQNTEWHRIAVFRPGLRDMAAARIQKGDRIYLTGTIRYSEYTPNSSESGTPVRTSSILADEIILLQPRRQTTETEELD